jgi:aspartyl-tRNA(Asn)/glutamyl-tRNA(Gln) amidotransferase subunit C
MTKVSKEEVKKIAQMSALELHDDEIESVMKRLEEVLSYAARVSQVAADAQEPSSKNVNVFREDLAKQGDREAILERAPEREDNFYVVPSIIEDK